MQTFSTRKISENKNTISDYIIFILMMILFALGTLYAFGEEERLAEEQGVAVNQLR